MRFLKYEKNKIDSRACQQPTKDKMKLRHGALTINSCDVTNKKYNIRHYSMQYSYYNIRYHNIQNHL